MNIWPNINYETNLTDFKTCKITYIESFFEKKFSTKNILVPSARSGFSLILKFLEFNNYKNIFLNKFSPFCMKLTLSYFSNINSNIKKVDLIIINHRYGIRQYLKNKNQKKRIVEDFADTIHFDETCFFSNKSEFEVVSLPKIISSYSGGLIYTKNQEFYKFAKKYQKKNKLLGILQSQKKYYSQKYKSINLDWWLDEIHNTYLDEMGLKNIILNLKNFEENKKIILKRRKIIEEKFGIKKKINTHIGPVFPFVIKKYRTSAPLPVYNISNKFIEDQRFTKNFLFPIHKNISEKKFFNILKSIQKK